MEQIKTKVIYFNISFYLQRPLNTSANKSSPMILKSYQCAIISNSTCSKHDLEVGNYVKIRPSKFESNRNSSSLFLIC